jgi:nucleoside-diphosphate-sugar epimerase
MSKILITGADGFIAGNLRKKLEDYNDVVLYGRENRPDQIEKDTEIIFHLAAELKKEDEMFYSNTWLTDDLLEVARKLPYLKAFVNVGSSSEYGRKSYPIKETDFLEPTTIYEGTKAAATLLCQSYARAYDLPIVTARPFTVYGPREQSFKLIPTVYNKIINNETIDLANGVHDFLYVDDFIDGLITLSKEPKERLQGDIVNFGTGVQTTNLQVVRLMEKILGKEAKINRVNKIRPYDSNCWVCDTRYAFLKYGWSALTSLKEGVGKYIEHEKMGKSSKNF